MAIDRVEIKDFLVFKGDFAIDFSPGVNVLIGGNGTGKTSLLKVLYWACEFSNKSVILDNGTNFYLNDYFMGIQADNGDRNNYTSTIRLFSDTISDKYPAFEVSVADGLSSYHIHANVQMPPKSALLLNGANKRFRAYLFQLLKCFSTQKDF
jgi:recombinational DNA repair ATPase RecF